MTSIIYTRAPPPPPSPHSPLQPTRVSSISPTSTTLSSPSSSSFTPSPSFSSVDGCLRFPSSAPASCSPSLMATPEDYSIDHLPSQAGPSVLHGRDQSSSCAPSSPPSRSRSSTERRLRARSRDFLPSWRGLRGKVVPKSQPDLVDEALPVQDGPTTPLHLVTPPALPACTLDAAFQSSDSEFDLPPAFYPGQAIPTVVTFRLDRYSFLHHSLNPTLTMSLIGTLHLPDCPSRTIICVSVSLSEGLRLWARDAQQAYAARPPLPNFPTVDPAVCLPGGTYSLPLTVQVPSTPRLPASFLVHGASFAVTYALAVTLTCDDPNRPGGRVYLAETSRTFEMMPETLPTRMPKYSTTTFWVRDRRLKGDVRTKTLATKWTVQPFLPTTTFSPTSLIPIRVRLCPPTDKELYEHVLSIPRPTYHILIRLAVIRREHASPSPFHTRDPSGQSGLVQEVEVMSRWTWQESTTEEPVDVESSLPLMIGNDWIHGFSTMLNVGPSSPSMGPDETVAVSSTFHLAITLAFLPRDHDHEGFLGRQRSITELIPRQYLPMPGVWTEPTSDPPFDVSGLKRVFPGTIRTLPLPIVIGSVAEPRSAMQTVRWSDLQLETSPSGEETGRIISGEALTCEDGWIQAPPSYVDAIETVPYEFN